MMVQTLVHVNVNLREEVLAIFKLKEVLATSFLSELIANFEV